MLESGQSNYAPDVRPVPDAAVEMFDYFDAKTGGYVMVWRVACRQHSD